MNSTIRLRPFLRSRVPGPRLLASVFAGDLVVLFAFIATGQASHGYFFWEVPVHTLLITTPFVVAWLVIAVSSGLFVPERIRNYRRLVPTVILAWTAASLVGGLIRSTSLVPGQAPVTFLLVNIVFGSLYLVPWRLVVSWQLNRSR